MFLTEEEKLVLALRRQRLDVKAREMGVAIMHADGVHSDKPWPWVNKAHEILRQLPEYKLPKGY